VIKKTITIFRNKKPKNLKFGLLGFLGFLKATSTALGRQLQLGDKLQSVGQVGRCESMHTPLLSAASL